MSIVKVGSELPSMTNLGVDDPRTVVVEFAIRDGNWLSSNGRRPHWTTIRERRKALRWIALAKARELNLPKLGKCKVCAYITPRSHGRFDPNNAEPTTKSLIDGLTDYGVFPDDSDEWVTGPDHRRGEGIAPPGVRMVRLVITETVPLDSP